MSAPVPTTAAVQLAGLRSPALAHVARVVAEEGSYPSNWNVVGLTFDDGPDPRFTPAALGILARYQVPATFFMTGRLASVYPGTVRDVAAAGQTIGGHTWDHVNLAMLPESGYASQVDRTDDLLAMLSGHEVHCVRPPGGAYSPAAGQLLAERGLTTMLWSVDPRDWARPGAAVIAARVLAGVQPGSVILLHDGGGDRSQTVAALPTILDGLIARGLTPVPLCR